MNDVVINKTNGGLGRKQPSDDGICALILQAVAISGGAQLSTPSASNIYELKSIKDAEGIGINAAYDTTNNVLVYDHITEFFRLSPNGTLFLMLVAQTVTLTQMLDKDNNFAKKLLQDKEGKVRMLSVGLNPAAGYTPVLATGLDSDVIAAIPKAQALITEEFIQHRPVNIFIEGRNFNGTATNAIDLRAQGAKDVMVVIGADPAVSARASAYNTYAAIGALLGTYSVAKVHENIGWPEKFNLQDKSVGRFLSAGLSSNKLTKSYSATDLNTLNTKGYVFVNSIVDISGVYWNDSHTCTLITDDYAYMENNRTINKAARLIRAALVPKLNSPLTVDSSTGKLAAEKAKSFENTANKALDPMAQGDEISGRDIYVDPDQDVLSTSELNVQCDITPTGTARKISVTLGFVNPF